MQIIIPCSRLSRKLLLREHGTEPIRVRSNSTLSDLLRVQRVTAYYEAEGMEARLDSHITLEVGKQLAAMLSNSKSNASLALHRAHLNEMFWFVWSQATVNCSTSTALRLFYTQNDLTEDDYSWESAHRLYVRFKAGREAREGQKMKKYGNILRAERGLNSRLLAASKRVEMPPDEDRLQATCAAIEAQLAELRKLKRCRPAAVPKTLLRQVRVFVFARTGKRHYKMLAKKFGVSKSQIFRDIERVNDFLQYDPDFAAAMRPAVLNAARSTAGHS